MFQPRGLPVHAQSHLGGRNTFLMMWDKTQMFPVTGGSQLALYANHNNGRGCFLQFTHLSGRQIPQYKRQGWILFAIFLQKLQMQYLHFSAQTTPSIP